MTDLKCNICGEFTAAAAAESSAVHSNVRAFKDESFVYVRCGSCGSLHARDEVDLGHYYAQYPFHNLPVDWRLHAMYANYLKRLQESGLKREDRVLDYGCGGGHFVTYLRERGYNVQGFDEYSPKFGDRAVLAERYDCIVSQDVLEHVPAPHALLEEFSRLTKPDALIALGTPNSIDSFCRWMEFRTPHVASIKGGSALKHLIFQRAEGGWYFEKKYSSVEDAWTEVRSGFVEAFRLAAAGQFTGIGQSGR